eukprot:jgi/Chlat1/9270/Chrsp99S08493
MDRAREWADARRGDASAWLKGTPDRVEEIRRVVDSVTDQAVQKATTGSAAALEIARQQAGEASGALSQWTEVYRHYEDVFFGHLHSGVNWLVENPNTALAVGGASLLLGMRGMSPVILPFWSSEVSTALNIGTAAFKAAEARVNSQKTAMEELQREVQKLEERAALAESEFTRGQSKLKAAGSQLRSLAKATSKQERAADDLIEELRLMRSGYALDLRGEVAKTSAAAAAQRRELLKRIDSIANLGISV